MRAWGLFGGAEGASGAILIRQKGDDEWRTFSEVYGTVSANKFADIQVHQGDRIKISSPGGGGYGAPAERDPELVLEDVREGYIAPAEAREIYRVVLDPGEPGDWRIDAEATRRLRQGEES